ncbi:hypothetical protein [Massilia sp. AB1]|uniref:hypothetical protein n=1 Tax=Massilia sp. AB1 TaxID=2823371 RepID=UPI001B831AB7|nr:hypothetical protein [Massilia sp. AB1]MBQ5939122.1 hypothetical protein [Massilia sp. AB1]
MSDTAARTERMRDLYEAGRYADLLVLLQQSLAEAELEVAPERTRFFMTMFHWKMLVEDYPPARAELEAARDEQAARLFAGDLYAGLDDDAAKDEDSFRRVQRFSLIADMNRTLGDARSTHALFVRLDAGQPALARQYAYLALPEVVEVGDFALADRYRHDPLRLLAEVNRDSTAWPLFPPPIHPRMSAQLSNLVRDVRIGIDVLRGLGRVAEADALPESLLSGLASGELRAWAQRELAEPGSITRHFVECQMALEDRASE